MSEIDWDEFSRVFDRFNQPKYNIILPMFCQWIVDRLDERGGDDPARFVEIGCGTGLISERLVEGYPDSEFLLNDNNPAMLRIAAERFESSEAVVDLEESEGEVFLSGLETDSIEVAIFARSFYAMSDHAAVARETLRALEPGGRVILLDFTGPAAIEPLDAIFGKEEPEKWPLLRRSYEEFNEGIASGRYRVFSKKEWVTLWREAGGKALTYQTNEPMSQTHFLCVTKVPA